MEKREIRRMEKQEEREKIVKCRKLGLVCMAMALLCILVGITYVDELYMVALLYLAGGGYLLVTKNHNFVR